MPKITQVPQVQGGRQRDSMVMRWRDWSKGYNDEDDPRELPEGFSEVIQNFEIDKRGKLVDTNGHTTVLSNIPGSLSITRVFQYKVTKPSAQTITIVIGTAGGLAKVYAVNTTLFVRPGDSNGWRDLTEYYTSSAEAGTSGVTTVADLGGIYQTADDLKGYYIINLSEGFSSIISASTYAAGSGYHTLTTTHALGPSAGAADTLIIMRYPLIGYYSSGAATDVDLSIPDANDVSFTLDNEALRINFGSSNNQTRGFWFGYIDRYWFTGDQFSNTTNIYGANHAGWWCEAQVLQRHKLINSPSSPVDADSLPADTYYVRTSLMYDGNQEGPLGQHNTAITTAEGDKIQQVLQMSFSPYIVGGESINLIGSETSGVELYLSPRITAINTYISIDDANYYLIDVLDITSDSSIDTASWSASGSFYSATVDITGSSYAGRGGEYSDRSGLGSYRYLGASDQPKCSVFCGAQTMVRGRRIVGSMRQPSPEDFEEFVFRIAAAMPHSNGTFNNDVFGLSLYEHIDIRTKQADGVMGLEELNGGLVAIKENSLHFIDFGGGRMDTWTIAVSNEDVGAVSKKSITRVPRAVIFAGEDNIFLFDGVNTRSIADAWKTTYQDISDKTSMAGSYYARRKQYRIYDPASKITYIYDLKTGAWSRNTVISLTPVDLLSTPDGDILWVASSQAYKMDQSGASTAIVGALSSSIKDIGGDYDWMLKEIEVIAKGTGTLIMQVYKNSGTALIASNTFTLTSTVARHTKRISAIANEVQVKIVTASNSTYDTEISEFSVTAVPIRKIRTAL